MTRRGESRERVLAAALSAVVASGPGGVSGRSIARDAGVHHAQIQQMFGSVDELVVTAVTRERDRFNGAAFGDDVSLPDPLLVAEFPLFWRSIAQVVLDPGPIDLRHLAAGGPVAMLGERLDGFRAAGDPTSAIAIAAAWASAPLGALIFERPLREGLGIADDRWDRCWRRLGTRIAALTESGSTPPIGSAAIGGAAIGSAPVGGSPQPTGSPSTPAPAERGRERLLRAAEELLGSRLETTVTGRELAAEAGVNYGLVNHYFGSKSAVFDEALTNLHQRFLADVLAVTSATAELGPFDVFARHRAFLRAWASRLLADRPTPKFELAGMERLMANLLAARGIEPTDRCASVDAAGDALAGVALLLGWTILQPLPTAIDPDGIGRVTAQLRAIYGWLLTGGG